MDVQHEAAENAYASLNFNIIWCSLTTLLTPPSTFILFLHTETHGHLSYTLPTPSHLDSDPPLHVRAPYFDLYLLDTRTRLCPL
jgi:hypothetical protein